MVARKTYWIVGEYCAHSLFSRGFETNSKSLDVYIGYLRRKTEEEGDSRLLYTIRGVGYTVKES